MRILAIETSCDETAAAVVENGHKIISNVVASSSEIHEKTGGIIPEIAAREQVKCIIPVINEAMKPFDALAVTIGPGLNGSLLVGTEAAKTISYVTGKPVIPVNHVIAHIYANWLLESDKDSSVKFPAVALVVSGGHTELFLMTSETKLRWLGGTRDDAAGEAFDKTARLLDLGFPGGPAIAAEAAMFKVQSSKFKVKLPRPMMEEENLEFSFSGLKTAVMREVTKLKEIGQFNRLTIQQLSYEIQESITDVLVSKTLKATTQFNAKSILLGGGVAANKRLKEKFQSTLRQNSGQAINNQQSTINLHIPSPNLCTDNAAYIASYAYFHNKPVPWQKIQSRPDLRVEV